jgi:hypothetical protein
MGLRPPSAGTGGAAPTITGTPQVGQTLTASGAIGDYFQWTRDGAPIAGATAKTYPVQAADIGHAIAVWHSPASSAVTGAPGAPAAWSNSKTITIDHTKVAGPLSNFTLALDLTNDAEVAARAKPDLSDIRFTDVNGGALSYEVESSGGSEVDVDSAWCWFNGPRAICNRGGVGPTNKVFLGGVTSGGSVLVSELNVDTGAVTRFGLHSALNNPMDDHDAPGIMVRPDGKLQAFYASHNANNGQILHRTSSAANDASAWAAEATITIGAGNQNVSYPKPFLLSSQGTSGTGRLWLFWRNNNDPQYLSFSDDLGATGIPGNARPLFTSPDTFPYFTCPVSNGVDRIDFLTTNSHPRIVDTDLFHFYYSAVDDSFHFSDGTVIVSRANLNATTGITPSMLRGTSSHIFVAGGATEKRSWGSDLCYDATGKPVVAFTTWNDTTNFTDPKYRVARWTGTAWLSTIVTDAGPATDGTGAPNPAGTIGPWIGPAVQAGTIERQYTGLVSILRSDTSKIYLSKRVVGPLTDQSTWELEQWSTPDAGVTWARSKRITPQSKQKNVRPLCPDRPGVLTTPPPDVFWMHGGYYHYRRYSTSLLCYPPKAAIPVKRGARVQVPSIDNVTDALVVMRYNNAGATDASGNPYTADTQMAVPLLGRVSSGNIWHHGDVQMSGWTALTISAWATVTGADGINDYLFNNAPETGSIDPAAILRVLNGTVSGFVVVNADTQIGGVFADKTGLNDGALHHYALVYDQVSLKLYVDGVISSTTFPATAALDISQGLNANLLQMPTMLGSLPMAAPYQRPIKGSIVDVRAYNVAKSAAWIQTQAKARGVAPLYTIGAEQ